MSEEDFKEFITKENLTLVAFAEIINTPLATVQKWGKSSKIPAWVSSFINYYYKAKELDELKKALQTVDKIINK